MADNSPLFKSVIKGFFVGFIVAFLFIIMASLLSSMGSTFPFITSIADMGLFGFFVGLGIEIYPVLV